MHLRLVDVFCFPGPLPSLSERPLRRKQPMNPTGIPKLEFCVAQGQGLTGSNNLRHDLSIRSLGPVWIIDFVEPLDAARVLVAHRA